MGVLDYREEIASELSAIERSDNSDDVVYWMRVYHAAVKIYRRREAAKTAARYAPEEHGKE